MFKCIWISEMNYSNATGIEEIGNILLQRTVM